MYIHILCIYTLCILNIYVYTYIYYVYILCILNIYYRLFYHFEEGAILKGGEPPLDETMVQR